MSTATKAKADRLIAERRVHDLPDAKVRVVEGDDGIYLVVLNNGAATCFCRATVPCSHIQAAMQR